MPKFKFSVPHPLGREKAEGKVRNFLAMAKRGYGQGVSLEKEEWNEGKVDFVLKIQGFKLTGSMEVETEQVDVHGTVPLTAYFFKGRIRKTLAEQLGKILRGRKKSTSKREEKPK